MHLSGKESLLKQPQTELRITRTEIVARGALAVLIVGALLFLLLAFTLAN